MTDIRDTAKQFSTFVTALEAVMKSVAELQGLKYDMEQMLKGVDKLAPFKSGDRVVLIRPPVINEATAPEWMHCRHFIIPGAVATVTAVKLREDGFVIDVEFDNESWIPSTTWGSVVKGVAQPVLPTERYTFGFAANRFQLLNEGVIR